MNVSNSVAIATKDIFKSAIQNGKEVFRQVKTGLAGKLSSAKQSQHELKSNNYNQRTLRTKIATHNIMSAAEKEFNSVNKKLYDYTSQLSKTAATDQKAGEVNTNTTASAATDQKAGEVNTNTTASYGKLWDTNLILLGDAQIIDQLAGRKTWDFSRKNRKTVLAELKPMVVPTVPTAELKPMVVPTVPTSDKPQVVPTSELQAAFKKFGLVN
ncbi:hypothetical protein E5C26_20200 [Serratia proteamaculans]|uniref:hypothetical protein n=1 Tax=Serratia proteamaculans TaxID=28151 RepID=UPI0010769904|nr:hypothetical protein [Serratia proteamaculans]TFZ48665.1 hypothetical protein E5C26_20200 [Serratia proteamaculans]